MPRLPSAEQLGARPVPQGSTRIIQQNIATPDPRIIGTVGAAAAKLGASITDVGEVMLADQMRVNTARADDAYVQYSRQLMDMELNPETGFQNKKGSDAVTRPLYNDYKTLREDARTKLEDSLSNDTQRNKFRQRASIADQGFDGKIYRHIAVESENYQSQVFDAFVQTKRQEAAQGWNKPGVVETALVEMDAAIDRQAERLKLDPLVVKNIKANNESTVHTDTVNLMLAEGHDAAAVEYFKAIRERLVPKDLRELATKVNTANTYGEAVRAVDEVWGAGGPTNANAPINMFDMEAVIREKYNDRPEVIKEAIGELRSRATAFNSQQAEQKAAYTSTVLNGFNSGVPISRLVKSPEFLALDGTTRDSVVAHMRQRQSGNIDYEDGLRERSGMRLYWQYSKPEVLNQMSEAQIMALEPQMGQRLVGSLLESHRKVKSSPDKVIAATIDDDMFKFHASNAGMDAYSPQTDKEKAKLGGLKEAIGAEISVAQRAKGRELFREEKEEIMKRTIDRKVMVDEWGRDPSVAAVSVLPEDVKNVYVPIKSIPSDWALAQINVMRSNGQVPLNMTDAEALRRMRERLEHGYAVQLTGAPESEIQRIMRGE